MIARTVQVKMRHSKLQLGQARSGASESLFNLFLELGYPGVRRSLLEVGIAAIGAYVTGCILLQTWVESWSSGMHGKKANFKHAACPGRHVRKSMTVSSCGRE